MFLRSKKLLVLIVVVLLFGHEHRQSAEGLRCWVCNVAPDKNPYECGADISEESVEVETNLPDPTCYVLEARDKTTNKFLYISRSFSVGGEGSKVGTCLDQSHANVNYKECHCNQDDCNKGEVNGVGGDNRNGAATTTGSGSPQSFGGNGIAVEFPSLVLLVVTRVMSGY
ncbi:hypothetical protein Ocin01_15909 [Orchesella cincta]|uniref:Protein sleepless n=1 Tax=Orchesella cincta TaxID=48709 RepID=A0A1D2MCP8_ORCCI|nr:hypothetical protein Ocin01_15909 [Orchesella cincta]